jgi:hypothetical protein
MWQGIIPAVTTKFTADDKLDFKEMSRCFDYQMDAGCDGLIACGSLGEGPFLSHDERIVASALSLVFGSFTLLRLGIFPTPGQGSRRHQRPRRTTSS